jgi:hypothetical protein
VVPLDVVDEDRHGGQTVERGVWSPVIGGPQPAAEGPSALGVGALQPPIGHSSSTVLLNRSPSGGRLRLRAGLAAGDPGGEVAAAWQGKELLGAAYRAVGPAAARAALDRFYRWCDGVQVPELSRLARSGLGLHL